MASNSCSDMVNNIGRDGSSSIRAFKTTVENQWERCAPRSLLKLLKYRE
jgi:hypothetical protein